MGIGERTGEAFNDAINQLMTLSAGAILVVATFLERFARGAKWQPLAGVAALLFLGSLVTLVVTKVNYAARLEYARENDDGRQVRPPMTLALAVWLFLLAAGSLAVFSARDFFS